MPEIIAWVGALRADGHTLTEVRVAPPWADHLIVTSTLPVGVVAPPLAGEEERAVAVTSTGELHAAVLCG